MPIQQKCCCGCPPDSPRCCVPDTANPLCEGECLCNISEEDCYDLDGIYYLSGPCTDPPCDPELGCCYSDPDCPGMKICEPKTFQDCQALNGIQTNYCNGECPGCNIGEVVVKYTGSSIKVFDKFRRLTTYNGLCNTINTITWVRNCAETASTGSEVFLRPWTTSLSNLSLMQQYYLAGGTAPGITIPPYIFTLFDGSVRTITLEPNNTILHIKRACSRLYAWASFNLAIIPTINIVPPSDYSYGVCSCDDCNCGTIPNCPGYPYCGTYPNCSPCQALTARTILASERQAYNYPWAYPSATVDHELAANRSKLFVGQLHIRLSGDITPTDSQMKSWGAGSFISAIKGSSSPEGKVSISANIPKCTYWSPGEFYIKSEINFGIKIKSDNIEFPLGKTPTYTLDYSYGYTPPEPGNPSNPCNQGTAWVLPPASSGTHGGYSV